MSQLASDDFNRANGALGANWTTQTATSPVISGNLVQNSALNDSSRMRYNAVVFPADQWAQIKVVAEASTSCGVAVILRASGSVSADNAYVLYTSGAVGAGAVLNIAKVVNFVFTSVTSSTITLALGDIISFQVIGTTLSWLQNGVLVGSITDTSLASGQPGLAIYMGSSGATTDAQLDNWAAGNFDLMPTQMN